VKFHVEHERTKAWALGVYREHSWTDSEFAILIGKYAFVWTFR
jgi:hypothetical protein